MRLVAAGFLLCALASQHAYCSGMLRWWQVDGNCAREIFPYFSPHCGGRGGKYSLPNTVVPAC